MTPRQSHRFRPLGATLLALVAFSAGCVAQLDDLDRLGTAAAATLQEEAEVEATVAVRVGLTVSALASTLRAPTATAPPTASPTGTPTPSLAALVQVSTATNCRSGPAAGYEYLGKLEVGETAEAVAVSSVPDYLYIANPDRPGEYCWLWNRYATVSGDLSGLPILTPMASPSAAPPFLLGFHDIFTCGEDYAVFKIQNLGPLSFMTAERQLFDLTDSRLIFKPELDRHPFAPGPADCPPGHDNRFHPGQAAYIYVPMDSAPPGHAVRATIVVCTEDYLGGVCITQRVDFAIP